MSENIDLSTAVSAARQEEFCEVLSIIERGRANTFREINRGLISLYWSVGEYISEKTRNGGWGKSVVTEFARFVQIMRPELKGFSAQNLWRMKQFYETYWNNPKLSPVVREISWTNNMVIIGRAQTDEAREFYLLLCSRNGYSKRELERQIDSMLFERTMISGEVNKSLLKSNPGLAALRDSYLFEFLDIPRNCGEGNMRESIAANMRDFILELGKDFTFVGQEYRLRVGKSNFYIDLLFYHRGLACLVAIELKTGNFKPEHLGQLEFYLEALDRDVRKSDENPSVGLVLCAGKDDAVVEYAMSRSLSPALVADYKLHLPDKTLLTEKLRELKEYAEYEIDDES